MKCTKRLYGASCEFCSHRRRRRNSTRQLRLVSVGGVYWVLYTVIIAYDAGCTSVYRAMRSVYFLAMCLFYIITPVVVQGEVCQRLPDDCYQPNGTDCEWYEQCLNRRIPCGIVAPNYTVSGFQLCHLQVNPNAMLSSDGFLAIQALRKCIHTSMLHLLNDTYASQRYLIFICGVYRRFGTLIPSVMLALGLRPRALNYWL